MRLALPLLALPVVVGSLTFAPRAEACGGGLVGAQGSTVTQESQLSFVSVHAATTDVAVLLQLPAADTDFGALIPLPASGEPTIDAAPVDSGAFATLEQETRPQFFSSGGDDGGGGCGCGSRALDGGANGEFGSRVVAGDPVDVGPVTAQWLVADDAAALDGWLADNGFVASAADLDVLDTYIAEGNGFLAFKRNSSGVAAERTAIGVHFNVPGDLRAVALRVTTLGAPDVLPLTTFVAFTSPVGPDSPFEAVHFEDLDPDAAVADYAGAVDDALAAAGGKAWVFEGAPGKAALTPSSLTALVDDGAFVSRLSTRLSAADRDVDVLFTAPAPTAQGTPASAAAMGLPKHVDVAAVFLVAATLVMRRRRR